MSLFIGCDLGGTNIKAGLVDLQAGNVILAKSSPTHGQNSPEDVMRRMADLINEIILTGGYTNNEIMAVGVSAPGLLDLDTGHTLFITNLAGHWINVPLEKTLRDILHLPVFILNDVRAITLGEHTFGAGRGTTNMACLAIGTGIGGGIIVNGQLELGIQGQAGELGHITIDINGPRCACGNNGCVEAFAAAPAIANYGVKAVQQGQVTLIGDLADYDLNKITPKLIAEAAQHGDEIASQIWEDVGHYIGTAVANTIVTFNPTRIVISGGVASAGELLLKPIRETIKKRVFLVPLDEIEVIQGELGNEAGILGMAKWASLRYEAEFPSQSH
jgi:glucokinase